MIKDSYSFYSDNIPIKITIETDKNEYVLIYKVSISRISENTEIILDKIRDELVSRVSLGITDISDPKKVQYIKKRFKDTIIYLVNKYFPDISEETKDFFTTYLMQKSFGLGKIEILLSDEHLEDIVINNAEEPVWVYHHSYGWLKTSIYVKDEGIIKHYSSLIGRKVGRSITLLRPLLDAHLESGDRVNATLFPVTTKGNTLSIRKFSARPITITDLLMTKVVSLSAASLIWTCVQYELSGLITGGTGSGKCVDGDTEVYLENDIIKIRELVENELKKGDILKTDDGFYTKDCNLNILSFNPENLKLEKRKVMQVWKREVSSNLYEIKTRSGKTIIVTPEHPFFTLKDEIKKIRSDELNVNDFIATPRKLDINSKDIIFDLDVLDCWKIDKGNYFLMRPKQRSNKYVKIPKKLDKKLSRFLGYLIGEGHISKNLIHTKVFNNNYEILNDVLSLGENIFGIKGKIRKYKDKTPFVEFTSKVIGEFFNKVLEIPEGKKSNTVYIKEDILFSKEGYLKEIITALFEGEAYISKNGNQLEFGSSSNKLVKDVSFILSRFGILHKTYFNGKRNRLFIYGEGLYNFNNKISMFTNDKKLRLNNQLLDFNTNVDVVPNVGEIIKYLNQKLKIYQREISGNLSRESISRYVCNERNPSRSSLLELTNNFEDRYNKLLEYKKEIINYYYIKNINDDILELITSIYKKIRLTRKDLAFISNINPLTLFEWENKRRKPNFKTINKVALNLIEQYNGYNEKLSLSYDCFDLGIKANEIASKTGLNTDSIYPYLRGEYKKQEVLSKISAGINTIKEDIKKDILSINDDVSRLKDLVIKNNKLKIKERINFIGTFLKKDFRLRELNRSLDEVSLLLFEATSPDVLDKINLLKNLALSDVFWDKIVEIKKIKPKEKWVYDLTVDKNHTFIANNMIVHNTTFLGAIANFIPPNQRIISIEDTREIQLSKHLHWVPMVTREPNTEGKGEVSMLDLVVNSLRMRPDRIIVGEIRKKREADILFEAMHTGHSVYATLHANDTQETLDRLLNPPIDIPRTLLPAVSMLCIMYRNRRTGVRRMFQFTEILKDARPNILLQLDLRQDKLLTISRSIRILPELEIQTGMNQQEINESLKEKGMILKWLVKKNINDVHDVGKIIATYYTNKDGLMSFIGKNV